MIKYKYRIKTKQEFIDQYGENWRIRVGWNHDNHMMDYLFNHIINETTHPITMDRFIICKIDRWYICKGMVIKTTVGIDYNEKKTLVYD